MNNNDKSSLLTAFILGAAIFIIGALWHWEAEDRFRQVKQVIEEAR
jgi:Co/Zn/Cd efflux system component